MKKSDNRLYSPHEIKYIEDNYDKMATREIAANLGRSAGSVSGKIAKLGLHKCGSYDKEKVEPATLPEPKPKRPFALREYKDPTGDVYHVIRRGGSYIITYRMYSFDIMSCKFNTRTTAEEMQAELDRYAEEYRWEEVDDARTG